jgi:hypothetical protein
MGPGGVTSPNSFGKAAQPFRPSPTRTNISDYLSPPQQSRALAQINNQSINNRTHKLTYTHTQLFTSSLLFGLEGGRGGGIGALLFLSRHHAKCSLLLAPPSLSSLYPYPFTATPRRSPSSNYKVTTKGSPKSYVTKGNDPNPTGFISPVTYNRKVSN